MNRYKPTLHEAVDACRFDSEDLSLPELRELAQRIEEDDEVEALLARSMAWDSQVAEAFDDVSIPEGLAQRLLANIASVERAVDGASSESTGSTNMNECDEVAAVSDVSELADCPEAAIVHRAPAAAAPRLRLKWLALAAGVAACLTIGVFAAVSISSSPVEVDVLIKEAREWVDGVLVQPWNPDVHSAPLKQFPLDSSILAKASGWQTLNTQYDRSAIVYDLRANPGQPLAALIVIRTGRSFDVGSHLPLHPQSATGQFCIGACQKNDFLYVLVVEGSQRAYQRMIKAPPPVF